MKNMFPKVMALVLGVCFVYSLTPSWSYDIRTPKEDRVQKKEDDLKSLQDQFSWWPTDAKPGPVKDTVKGGYWWWPNTPGEQRPWGNRGYVYVYKIIFDYKDEELPAPQPKELRPSLLVKKIIKNVKIYFDYNKSDLRDDAVAVLDSALKSLKKNPEASILISGHTDVRGSEEYNLNLGKNRAGAAKDYFLQNGIPEEKIKVLSRGKLDAVSPVSDLEGMAKDRNVQFMVAEVEEVMIPYPEKAPELKFQKVQQVDEGKYIVEEEQKMEGEIKVSTREYTIQQNDSLWKIAERELGDGHRWNYLYEMNKDNIKNPNKLKAGQKIIIPIE